MTTRDELRNRAGQFFHDFTSDVALENLLTAAHAYGLATGGEGFVDPRGQANGGGWNRLTRSEADALLGDLLTSVLAERVTELAEKLAKAEADRDRAVADPYVYMAEATRCHERLVRWDSGEAYKAIAKERDRVTKERDELLKRLDELRDTAAQRAAALEKELASAERDLATARESLVRSLIALRR